MKVLVWVLLVLAGVIIEAEVNAWSGPLQRALIRRAVAPLPKPDRERYRDEWYRELEAKPDAPVTRLIFVLSLVLRRGSLARALGVSRTVTGFTGALKGLGHIALAGLLIVFTLRTGGPVTTVFYIVIFAMLEISLYVLSLKLNPWVKCSKCKNQSWVSTYAHHVCPVCKGTGRELRFFRRFIFGEPVL